MKILIRDIAVLFGISEYEFQKGYCDGVQLYRSQDGLKILLSKLPIDIQERYRQSQPSSAEATVANNTASKPCVPKMVVSQEQSAENGDALPTITTIVVPVAKIDRVFLELYDKAPYYNKQEFDFYYPIIMDYQRCNDEISLDAFVEQYNQEHPERKTTTKTMYRKLKVFREGGKAALLGKYGKTRGRTTVPEDAYNIYHESYMMNSGVTSAKAWQVAVGLTVEAGGDFDSLPKKEAFARLFRNRTPKAVECLSKHGHAVYNRAHAPYIERDDSDLLAGQYWVADHFQEDHFVKVEGRKDPVRPWVTVWADVKSRKILEAHAYLTAPNSDTVFASFHAAALKYGAPKDALTDNGKDFRVRDFSGGRKGSRRVSLAMQLNMKIHFALPYRAQTKNVERHFRTLHASTSVWFKGFCGSSVDKRPERLAENIKSGNLETFEEYTKRLQEYVDNVQAKMPFTSGRHKGKSPDQIWREEYPIARKAGLVNEVTKEELDLLCYRTSKDLTVKRNRIKYSECGVTYTGDRLWEFDRRKVYLACNHGDMSKAHVYDAETHGFLCEADANWNIPMLAQHASDFDALKKALAQNRRVEKLIKKAASLEGIITPEEAMRALGVFAAAASNDPGTELPNVSNTDGHIMLTRKAGVLKKIEAQRKEGLHDLSYIRSLDWPDTDEDDEPLFGLESEVRAAAANGRKLLASAG